MREKYTSQVLDMPMREFLKATAEYVEKDTIDVDAIPTRGFLYKDGPFSMCNDGIISDVARSSSQIAKWIPTRGVITRNEHVAHLSWLAPEGFDGSETYIEYLAALDEIGVCDFGPSSDWQACEYAVGSYAMSFKSPIITRRDMGMLDCERSPIYRWRGPNQGLPIDNDADWALAKATYQLENHMNMNIVFGDPAAGQLMFEGLDVVIDTGWVTAHAMAGGACDFTDPLIINGTGLATPQAVLRKIKGAVRLIRQRARDRGVILTADDMCVYMPRSHWSYIADAIAWGALVGDAVSIGSENIVMNNDVRAFFDERQRIGAGYFGNGFIEIDAQPVPVITDDVMGANGTLDDESVVTGDIYVLTRSFGGLNILEQQYLDWSQLSKPTGLPLNEELYQNGIIRAGWMTLNNSCFQYFTELEGRLVSRFQPLQAKITDVTVTTILENENESTSFASEDFYAFGGRKGGQGNVLITGLGAE